MNTGRRLERGYRKRVMALFERDPFALMVAQRDGRGHVVTVALHSDFLLGIDEMPLRIAIVTMNRHERKCFLAIEVGYLDDMLVIDGHPIATERFCEPMTVEDCAEYYGYTTATVRTYLTRARHHLKSHLSIPPRDGHAALLARINGDAEWD